MRSKCWLIASILTIFVCVSPVTHSQAFDTVPAEPPVQEWTMVDITQYQPAQNDRLLVYLPTGSAYLVNDDSKTYAAFPILSGVQRNVYYLGHYYFAATPEQNWEIKSEDIKRDHVTFGPTGRFLRLYSDGKPTPYGIHDYKYSAKAFAKGDIYLSMGCLIMNNDNLNIIEKSYDANNHDMLVTTTKNPMDLMFLTNN